MSSRQLALLLLYANCPVNVPSQLMSNSDAVLWDNVNLLQRGSLLLVVPGMLRTTLGYLKVGSSALPLCAILPGGGPELMCIAPTLRPI